jgi:hypothetical protein
MVGKDGFRKNSNEILQELKTDINSGMPAETARDLVVGEVLGLNTIFGTAPLAGKQLLMVVAIATLPAFVLSAIKATFKFKFL